MSHRHPGMLKIQEIGFLNIRFGGQFDSIHAIADHFGCSLASVYTLLKETATDLGISHENLLFYPDFPHRGKKKTRTNQEGQEIDFSNSLELKHYFLRERLNYVGNFLAKEELLDTLQAVDLLRGVAKDLGGVE